MPSKLEQRSTTRTFSTLSQPKSTPQKETLPAKQTEDYVELPIHLIRFDSNIRTTYDEDEIASLAESIKNFGLQHPIKVYDENNQYVIIFGHRRYLAHKKAEMPTIKCFIRSKPDTLEKIYIQATENEHSVNISSEDREKYIKLLRDNYNQSVEEIAQKLGKKPSWIYTCLQAPDIRKKQGKPFADAGIALSTFDTRQLQGANEEEIQEALTQVTVDPHKKTEALKTVSKKVSERKKTGKKPHKHELPDEEPDINKYDLEDYDTPNTLTDDYESSSTEDEAPPPKTDTYKQMKLEITIGVDKNNQKVTLHTSCLGDTFDEDVVSLVKKHITTYYQGNGYTIRS